MLWLLPLSSLAKTVEITDWRSGLSEISEGWAEHDGDDAAWAARGFDDSGWQEVDLDALGPAKPGWRWYRLHVKTGSDTGNVQLLLQGGDGTYELYVNGERVDGPRLQSIFGGTRPAERVFVLSDDNGDGSKEGGGDFVLALRTHAPVAYSAWHLPLFLSVTLGQPTAIEYERVSLESERLYSVLPSVASYLLVCFAGIVAIALYSSERHQRDYLFLGLFLFLLGLSYGLYSLQDQGLLPLAANFLIADPLVYLFTIAQIEFTFSFAHEGVNRGWRLYEAALLLVAAVFIPLTWTGLFHSNTYVLLEAAITVPAAVLLPVMLFVWYRRGNREAVWLIGASLLPAAANVLFDLGTASILLGWRRFDFLDNPIQLGPIPIQTMSMASLLFLMAVGVVMFFRFTRVNREQARSSAELEAARGIQQRLVPQTLPEVPGCRIETAYFPAEEVGGDFYQVLPQRDGSTLIVVGDVSGKGLKAAMTGALAIGALRALSSEGLAPGALMARLNREIVGAEDGGFITCLCARIEPGGGVTLANAGHLSPYWNTQEVAVESGLPLGVFASEEYAETVLRLSPGDILMLLSDGIVEARDASSGELFGFERTRAISGKSAAEIAETAQRFGQEDDITVLTLAVS
jgi:phosphoserine phosphatase RsbU/P